MGTDVQKFFAGHAAPVDKSKLAEALGGFSANKNALLGKALLRLTKTGQWVFGIDNEMLPVGTKLIANPMSISSGYVAWWMGKIEGEIMQPLSMGPVDHSKLGPVNSGGIPPGKTQASGKGWETQASIDLITTGDTPLQLVYKTSSMGGMRELLTLAGEISFGLTEDPRRAYPVIELAIDSYMHKEFGKVFTPLLPIVGWLDETGKPVIPRDLLKSGKDLV